jgi:hypothetical protein
MDAIGFQHLIKPNTLRIDLVERCLVSLLHDQNRRIKQNRPLSPVPLLWLAMAWAAGLEISIENAAVAGSHSAFTVATNAGLTIDPVASNAEHVIGVIANGPHNPPITYPTQPESLAQQRP